MAFEEVCPARKALTCHLYKGIWLALGLFLSLLGLVSITQTGFTGGACGAFVCIHNMQFLVFVCLGWIVLNHLSILACRVSQENCFARWFITISNAWQEHLETRLNWAHPIRNTQGGFREQLCAPVRDGFSPFASLGPPSWIANMPWHG